jgi:hypothetical protein
LKIPWFAKIPRVKAVSEIDVERGRTSFLHSVREPWQATVHANGGEITVEDVVAGLLLLPSACWQRLRPKEPQNLSQFIDLSGVGIASDSEMKPFEEDL